MSQLPLPDHLKDADDEGILRFVITRAGLYAINSGLVKEIAEHCELRPDVLSRFMREGHFSPRAATLIESRLGRHYVQWEWLVNPRECLKNGGIY